jgi:hypothetical protein
MTLASIAICSLDVIGPFTASYLQQAPIKMDKPHFVFLNVQSHLMLDFKVHKINSVLSRGPLLV